MSETILAIKQINRKLDGRPQILITTEVRDHWVTVSQWLSKGANLMYASYVNGEFNASYFEEGEILLDGSPCTKADYIMSDFTCNMSIATIAATMAAMQMAQAKETSLAVALFANRKKALADKRDAAKAEADAILAQIATPADANLGF